MTVADQPQSLSVIGTLACEFLIAESGRLPVGPAIVAAACISIVLALLPAEHEAQMDGYLLATKAAQLFPS